MLTAVIAGISPMRIPKKPQDIALTFLTMTLSAPVAIGLFFLGLSKTSALSGSLLTAGAPILLVAAGAIVLKEKILPMEKIGIAITILGTLLLAVGPVVFTNTPGNFGSLEGNLIMVLATIADLTSTLLTKIAVKRGISMSLLAHGQFVLGALLFVPVVVLTHPIHSTINTLLGVPWEAHMGVLFMALLSGSLAYDIRNIGLSRIEVSEAAIFSYLQPVWAALLSILWLRETVTPSYLIGGAILIVGVVLSEYKRPASRQRRK